MRFIIWMTTFSLAPPGSSQCEESLRIALALCQVLGVPVSIKKLEGPATIIIFLGIELDTIALELRLPSDKLTRLRSIIKAWRNRISCTKRDLLSLIGHLQHACKVVRYGRTFLRRMINLSAQVKELHHHIRLNASFRSDLHWWATFLPSLEWGEHNVRPLKSSAWCTSCVGCIRELGNVEHLTHEGSGSSSNGRWHGNRCTSLSKSCSQLFSLVRYGVLNGRGKQLNVSAIMRQWWL